MNDPMNDRPWYEQAFDATYLQTYGPALVAKEKKIEPEIDFLVRHLRLRPDMAVLDLCCGQGRHAVRLAQRDLRVVGLDLSDIMLGETERAARGAGVAVECVRRDMRDIPWRDEFDAIVSLFNSFGYFDEDGENFKVLEGVARALKPTGRFCIDIINYAALLRHWQTRGWVDGEHGWHSLETCRMDWVHGILHAECVEIAPDGTRRTCTHKLRLFPAHELVTWLQRAGLDVDALYGDFNGSPYDFDSPQLIAVTRKR